MDVFPHGQMCLYIHIYIGCVCICATMGMAEKRNTESYATAVTIALVIANAMAIVFGDHGKDNNKNVLSPQQAVLPCGSASRWFHAQAISASLLLVSRQVPQLLPLGSVDPLDCFLQALNKCISALKAFRQGLTQSSTENLPAIFDGIEILRAPRVVLDQGHL